MRKFMLILMLILGISAQAQVDNYALEFTSAEGIANLGTQTGFTDKGSYTLQFWLCPSEWVKKAPIIRCGTFSVKLGNEHALVINDGTNHLTLTDNNIAVGKWAHVTIRSNSSTDSTQVTINNTTKYETDKYIALTARTKTIWLGGGFLGRIDEVRLFKKILPTDYASFWNNTLNKLCPSWANLVGYWKMEQTNCPNLVNYKYETNKATQITGMHGTMTETGVHRSKVTDNQNLRYLNILAYDNVYHLSSSFAKISSDTYGCLANHIAILGAYGTDEGHVVLDNITETYIKKMREANNLDGQKYIVTVHSMSFTDMNATMSDASKRQTMAEDILTIMNYDWVDGIDIDFEWFYSTAGWNYIAQMLKIVKASAPEGKIISVTPHNVTYSYPTGEMGNVDYFEFQQYGPQATHAYYSTFTSYAQAFVNYGYPKDKILLSYATISNNGTEGTIGYNWCASSIDENSDQFTYNGNTYVMNSLRQVEQRTIYARDNGLGGIFYWDMCNDVNPSSTKSMARQSSMYANANVQYHVTKIGTGHYAQSPANDTNPPIATADPEDQGGDAGEELQTLAEVQANKLALNVINTNGLGMIINNADQTNVWLAESSNSTYSASINHKSPNAMWLLIYYKSKYYLYNIGRGEFAEVTLFNVTSQPCTFSSTAYALKMTASKGIFTFHTYGSTESQSYMCASPQVSGKPLCQWTKDDNGSLWKLTTVPGYDTTEAYEKAMKLIDPEWTGIESPTQTLPQRGGSMYDMQGRRINYEPSQGVYIQDGKKIIR